LPAAGDRRAGAAVGVHSAMQMLGLDGLIDLMA
jgi:hypothetical protein